PVLAPRGGSETVAAYLARLAASDRKQLPATASLTWQDAATNLYGAIDAQATTTEQVPVLSITPQTPSSLLPGQSATLSFTAQNAVVAVANPDGSTATSTGVSVAGGQSATLQTTWMVPVVAPKGSGETDAAYQSRLAAIDNSALAFNASLAWNDSTGNHYGAV